ncbi:MAG: HU family DNA-binding protein [Deltaproteobacteria bacterium]|nr:HU family DNA-binding protein [Deltaproteobacteria bacterium]
MILGRNPQTGKPIVIPPRSILNFKPGEVLKKVMNPETPL